MGHSNSPHRKVPNQTSSSTPLPHYPDVRVTVGPTQIRQFCLCTASHAADCFSPRNPFCSCSRSGTHMSAPLRLELVATRQVPSFYKSPSTTTSPAVSTILTYSICFGGFTSHPANTHSPFSTPLAFATSELPHHRCTKHLAMWGAAQAHSLHVSRTATANSSSSDQRCLPLSQTT